MNNSVLIVNDVTGYGRVSTFAMLPIMTAYGLHPYVLPTSLVSNTMDYGSSAISDTSEFMKSAISKWQEFGFRFSNICTGFINSAEQVEIIKSLISKQDSPFVLVDPIMADDGKLYPNMYSGAVECNRKLAAYADVIIPNLTEAELLADMFTGEAVLSDEQLYTLVNKLSELGNCSIVITGCKSINNEHFNLCYTSYNNKINKILYDRIPQTFIGTGDVFSACLMSELVRGRKLDSAVRSASDFVRKVILENIDNDDHFDIRFEKTLSSMFNQ